jgi:hypothetical protein
MGVISKFLLYPMSLREVYLARPKHGSARFDVPFSQQVVSES